MQKRGACCASCSWPRFSRGTAAPLETARRIQISGHIVNPKLPARWTLSVVTAAALLGGCSLFHHHDNYYSKAQETKPLEVPPDLDAPVGSNELTVPAAGTPSAESTATGVAVGSAPPQASPSGDSLRVADSVGHTWTRVGIA